MNIPYLKTNCTVQELYEQLTEEQRNFTITIIDHKWNVYSNVAECVISLEDKEIKLS